MFEESEEARARAEALVELIITIAERRDECLMQPEYYAPRDERRLRLALRALGLASEAPQ